MWKSEQIQKDSWEKVYYPLGGWERANLLLVSEAIAWG
jgi:hypothetical protein